jgi:hypothetical protein
MKALWILTLLAIGTLVSQAQAGCGCPSCGCGHVKKVCRLVQETKKTTTYCYSSECEDYSTPGPSPCCGKKCVPNDCPCTGTHKEHIYGKPLFCGHPRTRKVLYKTPVTKETKVWTCKVERVCCGCGYSQLDAKATTEARAQEILPASAQEEIVLDPNSSFEENVAVIPATLNEQGRDSAAVHQVAVTEAPAVEEPVKKSSPKNFLERLFGK